MRNLKSMHILETGWINMFLFMNLIIMQIYEGLQSIYVAAKMYLINSSSAEDKNVVLDAKNFPPVISPFIK